MGSLPRIFDGMHEATGRKLNIPAVRLVWASFLLRYIGNARDTQLKNCVSTTIVALDLAVLCPGVPALNTHGSNNSQGSLVDPSNKSSHRTYLYVSVIKFKAILIERLENQNTIIRGRVSRVFRHNNVTISKGRVKIWSNANITCPSLVTGRVFLICGHENASKQKLLLSSTSLIETWSGETFRKIRKWQRQERKLDSKKEAKK